MLAGKYHSAPLLNQSLCGFSALVSQPRGDDKRLMLTGTLTTGDLDVSPVVTKWMGVARPLWSRKKRRNSKDIQYRLSMLTLSWDSELMCRKKCHPGGLKKNGLMGCLQWDGLSETPVPRLPTTLPAMTPHLLPGLCASRVEHSAEGPPSLAFRCPDLPCAFAALYGV